MGPHRSPEALVRELIDAENTRDRRKAEGILAADFTAITRARGDEQSREHLLDEIADPRSPTLRRTLIDTSVWTRSGGNLGVVRTLIETFDASNPAAAPNRFRNIHVFERLGQDWQCVGWQVTKVSAD